MGAVRTTTPWSVCVLLTFFIAMDASTTAAEPDEFELELFDELEQEADEAAGFSNDESSSKYTAVGRLSRKRSPRSTRYALLGPAGKPTAYVKPSPGVSLLPYLGRRVGVTAKAFTFRQGRLPMIVVQSVTALSDDTDFAVRQAAHQQVIPTVMDDLSSGISVGNEAIGVGAPIQAGVPTVSPEYDGPIAAHRPTGPDCSVCGNCGGGPCGVPGWLWVRPEYLLWWTDGMDVPPLVTRSPAGTARSDVGVLGRDPTEVIYGDGEILDSSRSGFRVRFGGWIDAASMWGIEGDYLNLSTESESFSASSNNGSPLIARPFFNINPTDPNTGQSAGPAREDAELIGFPGVVEGSTLR